MSTKRNHKRKYGIRDFSYSKRSVENGRPIPGALKFSVLFSGAMPMIGIVFTLSGLGFLVPAIAGGIPPEFLIVPLIFPIIGLSFLFFILRKRIKYLRIIQTGKFTSGTLDHYEPTNVRINNVPVYRFFFQF